MSNPTYARGESFPVLDVDRSQRDDEYGRLVIAKCPPLEPYIAEVDNWATMPLRVVTDQAAGVHVECGPYDLDSGDILAIETVINAYRDAVRRDELHVIDGGADR